MKKNKELIVLLIICLLIILGLGCTIRYLFLNNKNSIVDKEESNESEKLETLKVGDVGTLSQSVNLMNFMDENGLYTSDASLEIKNNKLFLVYNNQSIEINVAGENVIRIINGGNCTANNVILVLTEKGNIYTLYDNVTVYSGFGEDGYENDGVVDIGFSIENIVFEKINTDEIIYGIEIINPPHSTSCGNPELYAYTSAKTRKFVNVIRKTLEKTYEERWPYENYMSVISLACSDILRFSDGRITFGSDEFIKFEEEELKIKNAYEKDDPNNSNTANIYLVSNTNKVYLFTTNEDRCDEYEITDTGKIVSSVVKEKDNYYNSYKVMLNYTDGTSSDIFNIYMNENFE